VNLLDPPTAKVDSEGRLVLPAAVGARLGLAPGSPVLVDLQPDSLRLRRPVECLAKVYLESVHDADPPAWTGAQGASGRAGGVLSEAIFSRLLDSLAALDPVPAFVLGGRGEPLAHPGAVDMIERAKSHGIPRVELISDGCLLDEVMSRRLIEAGLDALWVSLGDTGAKSGAGADRGDRIPRVLDNLARFKEVRREIQVASLPPDEQARFHARLRMRDSWFLPEPVPTLGVLFVATKSNVGDLPDLVDETRRLGARRFIVSNALPRPGLPPDELLYGNHVDITPFPTLWSERLRLPLMDLDAQTTPALRAAVRSFQPELDHTDTSNVTGRCHFVEAGSALVTCGGDVCPCFPLVAGHDQTAGDDRSGSALSFGNLADSLLGEIWRDPAYVAFRRGVQEDCRQEGLPGCGRCLWSQGLVLCP
jgi:MoaA/NifB/PqqE/SkfB family radical SAM enzyme